MVSQSRDKKRNQFVSIFTIICIAISSLMFSCSHHRQVPTFVPKNLIGEWSVSVADGTRGVLHIKNDSIFLDFSGIYTYTGVSFKGIFLNSSNEQIRFKLLETRKHRRKNIYLSKYFEKRFAPPFYSNIDGFIIYNRNQGKSQYEGYHISFTQNDAQIKNGSIYKIKYPNARTRRGIGRNNSKTPFLYCDRDVESYKTETMDEFVSNSYIRKVEKSINATLSSGLNCGNKRSLSVKSGSVTKFSIPGGYFLKIVSPLGNNRLMYAVNCDAQINGSPNEFPTISISRRCRNASIDFWLLPIYEEDLVSDIEIPVNIYYFKKDIYAKIGSQECQFFEPSNFSRALTVGKLFFAIAMEMSRKDQEVKKKFIEEGISIYGRDYSIASALKDLFPKADKNTINYMTRNIGTLMQSGFDANSLAFANWRESVLQNLEKSPNMNGEVYRYADILLDTSLFLSNSFK